jgi:arylsulfatase A-like enzyme
VGTAKHLSGYKLSIKEGGIRVPGLMVWPRVVKEAKTINAPCVTSDYFPTILDALDIPLAKDRQYDGISLLPLIHGERITRNKAIGFLNENGSEAVWMEDQYKMIMNNNSVKLYDIPQDEGEKNDLSGKLPEVKARMQKELTDWKQEVMQELKTINNRKRAEQENPTGEN